MTFSPRINRFSRSLLLLVLCALTSCRTHQAIEESSHVNQTESLLSFSNPTGDLSGMPVRLISISANGSTTVEIPFGEEKLRLVAKPGAFYPSYANGETLQLVSSSYRAGTALVRRRVSLGNW